MAISKNGLTIFALLVTFVFLETWDFNEFPCLVSQEVVEEEDFLPHTRERRNVPAGQWNYIIDIVVNASNAEALEQIRASLNATDLPIQLDSHTEISDVSITTVCYSTGTGFQCRCEEQFAWPYSTCVTYGACDQTWSGICKCINAIPAGNQSCQPISGLLTRYEYEVEVELNVTDVGTVDYLRSLLNNNSFSLALGPVVNVTDIDITTVCYPNGTNFQCRCEDQNVWSYRDCLTYGACDEITSDTCRCINSIPSSGRYCQPNTVVQLYEYIVEVEIHVSDDAQIVQLRHALENISFPVRLSNTVNITQIDIIFTVTPVTYEYQIYIEMNTTDADQLRNTLKNMTFPVQIGTQINISDVDMINVCSQDGAGFQCRCEDDYLWPCDTCSTYGKCDGDTNNTCSCVKAIPTNGQYCQSIHNQNLTVCPLTTPAPPAVYKYLISVELNVSVVGLIDQLRTILSNISYPISIGNHIQISHVNMSTVCYPNSSTYQCRCEEQFRWPCHMCSTFGKCNDTFDNSCGCINAIPPDGQYCQSVDQYNLTSCPVTTPTPSATNLTSCPITTPSPTTSPVIYEYVISIELNTTDVAVMDRLRNISYPVGIGNDIQVLHINISTVCYPSSGGYQCRCEDQYRWSCDQCLTYGSCDNIMYDTCGCISAIPPDGQYCQPVDHHNFTACPPRTTSATNSTLDATTDANTTKASTTITIVTNSTPATAIATTPSVATNSTAATTEWNTTAIGTTPTVVTNSTPIATTHMNTTAAATSTVTNSTPTTTEWNTTAIGTTATVVSNSTPIATTQMNTTAAATSTVTNSTPATMDRNTTAIGTTQTVVTNSTPSTTDRNNTAIGTTPTVVTNSTPIATTHMNTTTAATATVTNSTPATTEWNTTAIGTTPTVVTNSTPIATTHMNTTTAATATVTNSTPATTEWNTTAIGTTPTVVTNSTPISTTHMNTTAAATATVTNSTPATTEWNTTAIGTSPTVVTNSTPTATTHMNTTTAATATVTNSTPATTERNTTAIGTTPTVVTNSTPIATTDMNTTTAATVTNSTPATTEWNTTAIGTTPTVVTNSTPTATTHMNTTTAATATVTNSTPATTERNTTAIGTTPTVVTNSTPIATTDMNTTTAATATVTNSTPATTEWNTTAIGTTPTVVTNSTPTATTHMNTTTAATATVTNSTPATTERNTTAIGTTPTVVTNSTPTATTHMNTTTAATATVTNSTPATTERNTTAIGTTPTVVTNSTPIATTDMNTTTAATATVTNSTPATTEWNTTAIGTTPTVVTNSTPTATTHMNTTTAATATVTNSTPATTERNTTAIGTTPTVVTNSTPIATTHMNTTTAATATVTNSTPATTEWNTTAIGTTPTVVTISTPVATTDRNTTTTLTTIRSSSTVATTVVTTTNVTSQNTTIGSTILEVPSTGLISTTSNTAATHVPNTPVTTFNTTTPTTTTTTAATTTPTTTTTTSTTITPSKITSTAATASATTTFTTTNTTITTSPTAATIIHTNTSATTTTITQTSTVFSVEMLMRLDKEYTTELNNPSSAVFKNFKSQIDSVLHEQYKGIPGYISGFVTRFSEGSVITDFVVQTTYVDFDKLAEENEKLPETIQPVAPVIGSVSAFYKSPTSITIPDLTYTGNTMFLRCEPPENFDLGLISSSRWKFKGREIKDGERIEITTSNNQSMLKVINIIPADRGLYSCTLRNKAMNFNQEGFVTETQIIQAPVVRLQGEVNVRCQNGQIQPLKCCVQRPYTVKWFQGIVPLNSVPVTEGKANCIKHDYKLENCIRSQEDKITFICRVDNPSSYEMKMTMTIFRDKSKCDDAQYGTGRVGDRSSIGCDEGQEGSKTAICQETGEWKLEVDTCIVTQIKELLIDSQDLVVEEVPQFVLNLSTVVQQEKTEIANSSATISAIVDILNTIANVSTAVNKTVMQNVLETIDVLISEDARDSWLILNANDSRNTSSALLGSMETLSSDLDGEFAIATQRILLNRTTFNNNFMADLNSSVVIDIPNTSMSNIFITTILLSTLNNVMPPRNSTFDVTLFNATSNETAINAVVVLIKINATVQKVLLRYNKLNSSLTLNPQCVFWNFTLFDNFGAWDDEGCTFVSDINNTVTCSCNHLTSFSILMATDIPPSLSEALDIITYFGVGISLASLVICLIIEGYVWKAITRNSTAFIRHVSIVNTALSLLIADICFIIGAFIAKNPLENPGEDYELPLGPCSTATFFMHFFYLALFFWMLVSGLLLFYRTVMVFSYMSKSAMLAIGFCLGYGCPLIIAVITVAVTAPGNGYIRKDNACWLNWIETKALLALVIPALTIVLINIFIVIVVLFKMLRRGVGESAQTDEKHTLVVIARCVIILTPLFGLTWSLGVGTMVSSTSKGLHIAFAFFNSLQGFFILVFGTLLDSKTRSILFRRLPTTSTGSNTTRSTSAGISSLSGTNLISRILGRRYIYHVSQAASSSSSGAAESFVNI
ncbi:uncharacterized protein LOC118290626 isoform X4 [Scophthalmus maximus]|uniref:uncharacterized protein LOC118290626 isoform X4 n=1 Tax=Scophthalmus maximus TaxID=52904 RepID=UPI001FA91501|nr:uncharacterized protein LOC118290626 isoform X4 [Scophthalmus maximus]